MTRTAIKNLISLVTSSSFRKYTTTTKMSLGKERESNLFRKLITLRDKNNDNNATDTLNEWVDQGNDINKRRLIGIVNELRKYRKYNRAIQVMDWWGERGNELSPGDHAIHLDLVAKTKGVDKAEKYFQSLPGNAKNELTYGALLHCYCKGNMLKEVTTLLEKMRELDYASSTLVYNNIMSLLVGVGEPRSVPIVIKEMKSKGISPDFHSYICLMNSYASLKDFESAERVLEEMKEAGVKCDWTVYTNLASIFIKEGLSDKANSVLKEVENMDKLRNRKAYHLLLTMYSSISNKLGVYRVWESLKLNFPETTNNGSYLVMLQALSTLGDTEELEKCFMEWERSFTYCDIRLTNVLIDSYLQRDMIEKAEKLCEDAVKRGAEPNIVTLKMFLRFYLKTHQMNMAFRYFEAAILKAKENHWKPSKESVSAFLKYFEEEKDADGADYLCKLLKNINCLPGDVYSSLYRTYVAAELTESQMHDRIKANGIKMSA